MTKKEIKIFHTNNWLDEGIDKTGYELLDTGGGEKLERFGPHAFVRPFLDAVWDKTLPKRDWENIDGKFWSSKVGAKAGWKFDKKINEKWEMGYKGIKFLALPTPFRHLGFFPEQAAHWDFIEESIKNALDSRGRTSRDPEVRPQIKFLNLFGYTGVASLFALRAGAEVTHLDASKQTLNWAKENQNSNAELAGAPMRIIEDDAIKFLEREAKRGNKYDCVIMDPPKFGRGPKGEVWKLEEMLSRLLSEVRKILSDRPLFVILTSYAIDSSSLTLGYALEEAMKDFKGSVRAGEMCVVEKSKGRLIPLAHTAVWERE